MKSTRLIKRGLDAAEGLPNDIDEVLARNVGACKEILTDPDPPDIGRHYAALMLTAARQAQAAIDRDDARAAAFATWSMMYWQQSLLVAEAEPKIIRHEAGADAKHAISRDEKDRALKRAPAIWESHPGWSNMNVARHLQKDHDYSVKTETIARWIGDLNPKNNPQ